MRTDERDIIFSRLGYKKGTDQYQDYYSKHPERLARDEYFRGRASKGGVGAVHFDPLNAPIIDSCFQFLGDIKHLAEQPLERETDEQRSDLGLADLDPAEMTRKIKGMATLFHVQKVGIAAMESEHYYSNRGRTAETYGCEVEEQLPYGIVLAVEMNWELVQRAPRLPETLASVQCYMDAGVAGMVLTYYIRQLGYKARNHMDGNYLLMASKVAEAAGLGEFGRHGLLVTPEYGPRVRFSVVTTDLPLMPDAPMSFGLKEFCEVCGICARNCPGRAISAGPSDIIGGKQRWKSDEDACFEGWLQFGTDCGICMVSCPLSAGLSPEALSNLKNQEVQRKVLADHRLKYGTRPFIPKDLPWMK